MTWSTTIESFLANDHTLGDLLDYANVLKACATSHSVTHLTMVSNIHEVRVEFSSQPRVLIVGDLPLFEREGEDLYYPLDVFLAELDKRISAASAA